MIKLLRSLAKKETGTERVVPQPQSTPVVPAAASLGPALPTESSLATPHDEPSSSFSDPPSMVGTVTLADGAGQQPIQNTQNSEPLPTVAMVLDKANAGDFTHLVDGQHRVNFQALAEEYKLVCERGTFRFAKEGASQLR